MRLLLKRSTQPNRLLPWRTDFVLWARFELTNDERIIIRRFNMEKGYLTIEGSWRDFKNACLFAFFPALLVTFLLVNMINLFFFGLLLALVGSYVLITWLLYEHLREAISMNDIINGRNFKNHSAIFLVRRERRIVGYAVGFKSLLEMLRSAEDTNIIDLGEEHESALRVVTDTYAPA
jgi:hypothetical protein